MFSNLEAQNDSIDERKIEFEKYESLINENLLKGNLSLSRTLLSELESRWKESDANIRKNINNAQLSYLKASVLKVAGNLDSSLKYYLECERLLDKTELQQQEIGLLRNAYSWISDRYRMIGNYDQAIAYRNRQLQVYHNYSSNQDTIRHLYDPFLNLGHIYFDQNKIIQALEYYHNAVYSLNSVREYFTRKGDIEAWSEFFQAWYIATYNALGKAHLAANQLDSAEFYFNRSLEKFYMSEKYIEADILMGDLFKKKVKYKSALGYYEKALDLYQSYFPDFNSNIALIHWKISEALELNGTSEEALQHIQMALEKLSLDEVVSMDNGTTVSPQFSNPSSEQVHSKFDVFKILLSKLRLLNKIHKIDPARLEPGLAWQTAMICIDLLDSLLASYPALEDQQYLLDQHYELFENAITSGVNFYRYHPDTNIIKTLYNYSEQYKSIFIKNSISKQAMRLQEGWNDAEFRYEERLMKKRNALKEGLNEQRSKREIYQSLYQEYQKNEDSIQQFYGKYALSTQSVVGEKTDLLSIQKSLTEDQAVIHYFEGQEFIIFFMTKNDDFIFYLSEIDQEYQDQVGYFLHGFYSTSPYAPLEVDYKWVESACYLYNLLIQPMISDTLPETLFIVADGQLNYLPFSCLIATKPEKDQSYQDFDFLIRIHDIGYSYSSTLLLQMQKSQRTNNHQMLAMAPDFTIGNSETDEFTFRPLKFAIEEVIQLEKILPGKKLLGRSASKETFELNAGEYGILHLSTHAKADNISGEDCFLAFGSAESDRLFVKDILSMHLSSDLVTLSACETGLGEFQRAEGLVSLAYSFASAGAKSILTTLWPVNDQTSSKLMIDFYKNLKSGKSKTKALAKAQRDYLNLTDQWTNKHPSYWAGFSLVGDPRPLEYLSEPSIWKFIIFIMALIAVALIWRLSGRTKS